MHNSHFRKVKVIIIIIITLLKFTFTTIIKIKILKIKNYSLLMLLLFNNCSNFPYYFLMLLIKINFITFRVINAIPPIFIVISTKKASFMQANFFIISIIISQNNYDFDIIITVLN